MTGYGTTDLWQRLYTPPPPGEPACAGVNPGLFEVDRLDAAWLARAVGSGRPVPPPIRYRLDVALRYCARCPLAVREWCDRDATRPTESGVGIIAGGRVYSRGTVVWDLDRQAESAA